MDSLVEQLPCAVLQHILTYAEEEYVTSMYPRRPRLPVKLFATLEAVGGAWKPAINELQREFYASVVNIQLTSQQFTAKPNAVTQWLRHHLMHRSAPIYSLELGLEMLELRRSFEVVAARSLTESFDRISIDWMQIFALCTKLQRLDLSALPLRSVHLLSILEASSVHCLELKSLTLPGKEWYRAPLGLDCQPLFQTLYKAMDRWCHTSHGGLRQLTVPQRISCCDDTTAVVAAADEFLHAVATSCPQIEYLDGWKAGLRECDGILRCDERIDCSPQVWELFCRSCTKLRELNWIVFPFADEYFDVFAAYPKPHLSALTLMNGFTSRASDSDFEQRPSACHADSVHRSLMACPALKELTIVFPDETADDTELPIENYVNDALLKTIATSCRHLSRLEIRHVDSYDTGVPMSAQDSEGGITDEGCAMLAKLPNLRECRVAVSSSIGANGLFALMEQAPLAGAARHIDALVGNHDLPSLSRPREDRLQPEPSSSSSSISLLGPGPSLSFHTLLLELMERMIAGHARLQGRHFRAEIHNGSSLYIDDHACWQRRLEDCTARLEAACSELSLHIVHHGGVLTATLSQSGRETPRTFSGIHTTRPKPSSDHSGGFSWKTLALCATLNVVALGAAVRAYSSNIAQIAS